MKCERNRNGLDFIYSTICYKRLTSHTPLRVLYGEDKTRYRCYLSCPKCKCDDYSRLYCSEGNMLSTRYLPKNELDVSAIQYLATRKIVPTYYSLQDSERVAGHISIR